MSRAPIDPNIVTSLRLPLAPVAVYCLLQDTIWGVVLAAVLALGLELTDLADGWLARKYRSVTDFGKLYDPFSDAFTRYTLFLGLYAVGREAPISADAVIIADLWMIIAIFWRDASVSFFRTVAATRNVVVSARQSGKIKAIVQGAGTQLIFLTLVLMKLFPEWPLQQVPYWTMFVMTIVTLASFVDYFAGSLHILRDAWRNRPVKQR